MIEEGVVEMSQDHTTMCKTVGAWGVIYSATGAAIVSILSVKSTWYLSILIIKRSDYFPGKYTVVAEIYRINYAIKRFGY